MPSSFPGVSSAPETTAAANPRVVAEASTTCHTLVSPGSGSTVGCGSTSPSSTGMASVPFSHSNATSTSVGAESWASTQDGLSQRARRRKAATRQHSRGASVMCAH